MPGWMSDKWRWRAALHSWHLLSPTACWARGWAPRRLFKFNLLPPMKHDLLPSSQGWGRGRRVLAAGRRLPDQHRMPDSRVERSDHSDSMVLTNCIDLAGLPKEVVGWERTFQGLYKIDVLFKDYIKRGKKSIFPGDGKRCSWETNDLKR